MNYLCTGSGGFIGSHLVDRLLRDGHRVTVIDNFSTGRHKNLTPHPNLTIVATSILEPIDEYFEGIDAVFHLAALTKIQESIAQPEEYDRINVGGTVKIFTHAKNHHVKRVVFVSSSSAYGDNVVPTPEDVQLNPMCPYALQKQIGEQYARLFGILLRLIV
jgi:UDP-glucose 4-epimerase